MHMSPTTFKGNSKEYARLLAAAKMMSAYTTDGTNYYVSDTFFDFGQNWRWTTILAKNHDRYYDSWQALYPRQWEDILNCETPRELGEVVDRLITELGNKN